jgi:hypothetical protein
MDKKLREIAESLFNNPISRIFSAMMVMSLVVICCSVGLAFLYVVGVSSQITQLIQDIKNNFASSISTQVYVDRLEILSRTSIDSGIMQFLFQIITAGLITGGVWLLSQAHTSVNESKSIVHDAEIRGRNAQMIVDIAEAKVKVVSPLVASATLTAAIMSDLILMSHTTRTAFAQSSDIVDLNETRDLCKSILQYLTDAQKEQLGIQERQYAFLVDELERIYRCLQQNEGSATEDVVGMCGRCLSTLRGGDFIQRYKHQMAILNTRNPTADAPSSMNN